MSWVLEYGLDGSDVCISIVNNDETVYAYFTSGEQGRGFVWLYNLVDSPPKVVQYREDEPPIQPMHLITPVPFRIPEQEDFSFSMIDPVKDFHGIYIRDQLHAIVGRGTMPGWCILAAEPGDLANVLDLSDDPPSDENSQWPEYEITEGKPE